jgi:2,3-dihydroxybenzoate-AMP ligase
MDVVDFMDADLSTLELLQVGGAKFNPEPAARVRETLGCDLQQVFGMAEGLLNFTRLDDTSELKITTQGAPLCPADELLIVDEEGEPVAFGESGELLTRGPYTLRGYYRAAEHNERAFTADGYYRSGDVVRQLPSGHLIVEGRRKDQINRGGEKIPAEELENHLLAHPAVHDAAVVGMPDEVMGERTCAFIVVKGDAPTLRELTAFLRERGVAAYKLPDRLEVLDSFPQTKVGKVSKVALVRLLTGENG